jgi:hypothetical protein
VIAQLDTLIADLEHDIEVATERLRLARELRSTWDDGGEPTVEVDAAPEAPPPKKAAAKPKMVSGHKCSAATHTRSGLAKHTDAAHRRGLKGDEHVARAS